MEHVITAACNTGTWQQKWNCGTHAQNVGWDSGGHFVQGAVPIVVVGLIIFILIALARSRSGSPAASKS